MRYLTPIMAAGLLFLSFCAGWAAPRGFSAEADGIFFYFNDQPPYYAYTGDPITVTATVGISVVEEGTFIDGVHTHPEWSVTIKRDGVTINTVAFTHPGPYVAEEISITLPADPDSYTYTATLDAMSSSDTAVVTGYQLIVATDKTSICAGAVNSAPHQTTITATLTEIDTGLPVAGKTVNFSPIDSYPEYPSSLSATSGTTNASGQVEVTLTSSRKLYADTRVVAFSEGLSAESNAVLMDAPNFTATIDPTELPADGVSTATLAIALTYGSDGVDLHEIAWRINRIWDELGTLVYSADPVYGSATGYGSLNPISGSTGGNGSAETTYTVGTLGGFIEFAVMDSSIVANSPLAITFMASMKSDTFYLFTTPNQKGPGLSSGNNLTRKYYLWPWAAVKKVGTTMPSTTALYLHGKRATTGDNATAPTLTLQTADNTATPANESPQTVGGSKIWFYIPTGTYPTAGWEITTLRGRWELEAKDSAGTRYANQVTTFFFINKREQISKTAVSYVSETKYPSSSGFMLCNSFVGKVYTQLGLPINQASAVTVDASCTVPDSGMGSIIIYDQLKMSPTSVHPGHVAICVGAARVNTNSGSKRVMIPGEEERTCSSGDVWLESIYAGVGGADPILSIMRSGTTVNLDAP